MIFKVYIKFHIQNTAKQCVAFVLETFCGSKGWPVTRHLRVTHRAIPLITAGAVTMVAARPRDFVFLCKKYVVHC